MAGKEVFSTHRAPEPKGPYSQAVVYNGLLYLSGQIPLDPAEGRLLRGTVEEETLMVLNNIKTIVEEAGAGLKDVIKVTCYLADMDDFDRFNKIYESFFSQEPPARTALQAGRLPLDVQIEVDAIAALPSQRE